VLGAAVALLVVEMALGAFHFGQPKLADPCTSKPAFSGGGIDGEIQRFALSGLNGAACKLDTTREELVLSFVPAAGTKRVRWDRKTIEKIPWLASPWMIGVSATVHVMPRSKEWNTRAAGPPVPNQTSFLP